MELTSVCTDCGQIFLVENGHACSGRCAALALTPGNAEGPAAAYSQAFPAGVPSPVKGGNSHGHLSNTHRQRDGATPVTPRLPHIAACLAGAAGAYAIARLRSQVKALADGQDALDRGVVEAGAAADLMGHRVSALFTLLSTTPRQAADLIERADQAAQQAGDTLEVPRPGGLPAGHPESLVTELNPADEDELAELCTALWPNDEYLGITAEGPGAS